MPMLADIILYCYTLVSYHFAIFCDHGIDFVVQYRY